MPDMTPDEFRSYGHRVVDWIADYAERVHELPVRSRLAPGDVRAALPTHPPEQGEPFDAVLADLDRIVLPGVTHWQHPSYFAYFPANASGPAILGDLLSSGLGVQGMLWATSPACTELEMVVVDWLAELLGMPADFTHAGTGGGIIQDSASSAGLVALLAARHRASGGAVERGGVTGRQTVYVSSETHSSLEKAVRMVGLGTDNLRAIPVDESFAMDPVALDRAIAADVAAGATPAFVCATVGTTGVGAVDPVRAIGEVCRRHGAWLHVDAAYAGVAAVCPEFRQLNDGVAEYADSYVTNPHKWLLTNFDCSVFWVRDRGPLVDALSILPEFLRNAATESGAVVDYRDWQVPLGRRFRALKLWSVIRWYGAAGLREHIRSDVELARRFAELVAADDRFELVARRLGLVCLRPRWESLVGADAAAADELTARLLGRLNDSGALYLSHAEARGRTVLRFCIGAPATEWRHVRAAWDRIAAGVDGIGAAR
jgi:aromatic-L-amino-acid decarboxylase